MRLLWWRVSIIAVSVRLLTGRRFATPATLSSLKEQLREYTCFFTPHRAYIVNFEYVNGLATSELIMADGRRIPIPQIFIEAEESLYGLCLLNVLNQALKYVLYKNGLSPIDVRLFCAFRIKDWMVSLYICFSILERGNKSIRTGS